VDTDATAETLVLRGDPLAELSSESIRRQDLIKCFIVVLDLSVEQFRYEVIVPRTVHRGHLNCEMSEAILQSKKAGVVAPRKIVRRSSETDVLRRLQADCEPAE
jgi:hypothetical protein